MEGSKLGAKTADSLGAVLPTQECGFSLADALVTIFLASILASFATSESYVNAGDVIYVWKRWNGVVPFMHYGVYCGNDTVIHHPGWMDGDREGKICRVTLEKFARGGQPKVWEFLTECFSPDVVVARAESRLGEASYHLQQSNCEHFARWCKTGQAESFQVMVGGALALMRVWPPLGVLALVAACGGVGIDPGWGRGPAQPQVANSGGEIT